MNGLLMILGQADQVAEAAAGIDTLQHVASAPERITLWDMAVNGGWIMLLLALLLVLAIYIFIERYLTLNGALRGEEDSQFMDKVRQHVHEGNIEAARSLSKQTDTPLGRMISKGFSRLGRPLPDIQAAIENEGQLEVANLEKRVSLVATVASLGPMLGFLGTVTGMITAFQDMAHAGNNIDIQLLSTGIYEAMVTTVGGLIVGIICYFLHNLLVTRINKVVFELEVRANEFMDLLHEPA
ncbi:MAG: MotA/TolQ/ExbB proton channel family protein [Bacteroidales bacterium]|nr:MotA/TolQ/ExbB proton channel family protein [Bacteroidales bacterium]